MLKNVVLLVGLSGAGKSYCAHKSCESFWDTRRFAGDEVCRNVLSMFNVERFSLGNTEKWQKINKLGNIQLAQYWLFSLLLQQVHVENAISDGYRYFFKEDRDCLEAALNAVAPHARVTYIHLCPELSAYNRYRRTKGLKALSDECRKSIFSKFDTSFVDHEVSSLNELSLVLYSLGFKKRSATVDLRDVSVHIPVLSDVSQPKFDINEVMRLNASVFSKLAVIPMFFARVRKALRRQFSRIRGH